MINEIRIFQNNNKTITATIDGLDSLSGYTALLSVRQNIESTGMTFQLTGVTVDLTTTFEILPENTNNLNGTYNYDITYSDGTNNYTAIQSILIISESVLW